MIEFKLPELGENIEQGDLVRLMVSPGAAVSAGQAVMELETDKAVVEVPSSVSGTIQEIRVKEGDKIKVGQVVFTVENNGSAAASAEPLSPASPVPATSPRPSQPPPAEPRAAAVPPSSALPPVERRAPVSGAAEF
ncbi:MAG: biotin/lipoyl-containing protein, partial [Candidatus Sulfotelmatobacter sp.]